MKIYLSQFKSVIMVFLLILLFINPLSADQSAEIVKLEARIAVDISENGSIVYTLSEPLHRKNRATLSLFRATC